MVLYISYVCLLHSRFIKNHPFDLEVIDPSFLRWFYHKMLPVFLPLHLNVVRIC
jgi:hypothetical protein